VARTDARSVHAVLDLLVLFDQAKRTSNKMRSISKIKAVSKAGEVEIFFIAFSLLPFKQLISNVWFIISQRSFERFSESGQTAHADRV
jgi:hypothetical protein